jgi:Spy/CpxP family protein refolding chaperone
MQTFKTLILAAAVAGLPLAAMAQAVSSAPYDKNQPANQAQSQSPQQAPPSQGGTASGAGEGGGSGK